MASDEGSSPILGNLAFRQQFEGAAEIAADLSKQNHEAEQAEPITTENPFTLMTFPLFPPTVTTS